MLMLDTATAASLIRGRIPPQVFGQLDDAPLTDMCVSAVTRAELLLGLKSQREHLALSSTIACFFKMVKVLAWDTSASDRYAEVRPQLLEQGLSVGEMDIMVAAHALAVGATLVTDRPEVFNALPMPISVLTWKGH